MNLAKFAIKRPIFISCIVLIIVIMGLISYFDIGLELIPDIDFPIVTVKSIYSGASPAEMETLVSKPLEDELSSIAGIKHLSSQNTESFSILMLEFNMDIDVEQAAQDVRDKVSNVRNKLPTDMTDDPLVQKYDPDSMPVLKLAVMSNLPPAQAYDLANEKLKNQISRVKDVGTIDILGGSKREIQIEIDHNKMNEYRMSMINLTSTMQASGANVSIGKQEHGLTQTAFRSMGDYTSVRQIGNTLLSFSGDVGNSVSINTIGHVRDDVVDVTSRAYMYYPDQAEQAIANGFPRGTQSCIYMNVIKQSKTNTVAVCNAVKKELEKINKQLENEPGNPQVRVTVDQSHWIKVNIQETVLSIILGIILAVFVVFMFLGNLRSTIITSIAIPNSLLGAVFIMYLFGYTFNLMTLMALSLVVGLLVDDAIVVRENIFRKLEDGMHPHKAAEKGTMEVMLAVVATTLAIISVFAPMGMLSGVIGKIMMPFGFTVVFAMLVSLFDALAVAPFLSAYFAGSGEKSKLKIVVQFHKFQDWLDKVYEKIIKLCLAHPLRVVLMALVVFALCVPLLKYGVVVTFTPEANEGEFTINVDMPPGTSLDGTQALLENIEDELRNVPELEYYGVTVGNTSGDATKGSIDCFLKKKRKKNTQEVKADVRKLLAAFSYAHPSVDELGAIAGVRSPFSFIVSGDNLEDVEKTSAQIMEKFSEIPDLVDLNSTVKAGKPEFQLLFDDLKMQNLGVSSTTAGLEMRYNVTGAIVGQYKEKGYTYDIRARLKPEQRDIQKLFYTMKVPNANGVMVPLANVARGEYTTGSAQINRYDKAYQAKIYANIKKGSGLSTTMQKATASLAGLEAPAGITYSFSGQAESSTETISSILFALAIAILFIYMVLSSLYESFVTPMSILLAVPPAITGALFALWMTGFMLDIFSMIGMIMLVGLVSKNSILLVDNAVHNLNSGMERKEAILKAGLRRLRPILMTTFAMLAGMLPLALGIGEAAQMRQSMGIAIIGGVTLSTLISLLLVPAVFEYIDKFRAATEAKIIVRIPEHSITDKEEDLPEPKKQLTSSDTAAEKRKKTSKK